MPLTFLPPLLLGSVDVVLELDAHLSLIRLVSDKRMFHQLLCGWPLAVVLHQAALNKRLEFLGPARQET